MFDRSITQSVCSFNRKSNHITADFSMFDSFLLQRLHTYYYLLYVLDVNYGIIIVDMLMKCTCHGGK